MQERFDKEKVDFFQNLAAHSDNRFDNRLNFFLVFESVLLGVVGVLYSKSTAQNPILISILILGLLITLLWGYVQSREKYLSETAFAQLKEMVPEYQEFVLKRESAKWFIHPTVLLTYGIPTLVALVWIMILVFVLVT
jgi:hypothetical protein